MAAPFKNLKVIELANVLAGPATGMFFSELGAKVIKVENKSTGGDVTRSWKLPSEDPKSKESAYYHSVNWNKKTVFADLKNKTDQSKVLKLIEDADIVIANFKKGDAEKLGMDFKSLKKKNPGLIYGQITGFGEESTRTAFDIVLQAESGFMFMNGTALSGPVKMPVALIDLLAAHQLKEGILTAMLTRAKTGKGSKVSVSLYDAAIASLANQASNWLVANYDPQPLGSLHPNIAPYGELFETSDKKKIVLAVGNDKQFKNLCKVLKAEQLFQNEKFSSNSKRVKNRIALFSELEKVIQKRDSEKLMKEFIKNDVPAGKIRSVREALQNQASKDLIMGKKTVKSVIFKVNP